MSVAEATRLYQAATESLRTLRTRAGGCITFEDEILALSGEVARTRADMERAWCEALL